MNWRQITDQCKRLAGEVRESWAQPSRDRDDMAAFRHPGRSAATSRRASGPPHTLARLRSTADLPRVVAAVTAAMPAWGYSERDVFAVRLALEEAVVNGLKHGNAGDPAKEVRVRYRVTAEEVVAEVVDEGPGFDPDQVPDPRALENLERPGGRGLFLMRAYMTWVSFNRQGNRVTLARQRSDP